MPMQCRKISLTHFRNYTYRSFHFNEKLVGICGNNGSGKTNLLDAIYYSCFTKSYFSNSDAQSVKHGCGGMRIESLFEKNNEAFTVVTILRENNRKEILVNGEQYTRFSRHIGKFPCVMIAPDDVSLINGTSAERRKMVDTVLSQLNAAYLQALIDYNKILQQRNSLLKISAERNRLDEELLSVLDSQLAEKGNFIFEARKKFLASFMPDAIADYIQIAGAGENINMLYESQLHGKDFLLLLQENRSRDVYMQRTGCGIHKDDVAVYMAGIPFKNIASQGQKKTMLFAMKLAEFSTLKAAAGFAPLLLLDDVFEKLDAARMQQLLLEVCSRPDTQIFITDTHRQRLEEALIQTGQPCQLIELEKE